MRRFLPRLPAALVLAFLPAVAATVMAVLYTAMGNAALARLASQELSRVFRGRFEVGRVTGSFVRSLELDSVVIHDTLGDPFASVPRLTVRFAAPNLLAGRFVFSSADLERPNVRIVKRQNGRLNYQEILRLGENEGPGGGPPPLVEVRNLRIHDAQIELRLPWNPPDTATTPDMIAAALTADRARPGRIVLQTIDGLRRIVTLSGVNARFPLLRISSPDDAPLTFDVDSLSTQVSDPAIHLVNLVAHGWTRGDSLALTAQRVALASSQLSGGGVITWPNGPVRFDLTLVAPRVALRDLRWISPDFPDFTGHAVVTARARSDELTGYTIQDLDLTGVAGRVAGSVTALVNERRGLGVEGMALELEDLNLDVPRPYFDTMPLHGTVSGKLLGDGYRDSLDLDADLTFHDSTGAGATSQLAARGHLVLGGPDGTLFDTVVVSHGDIDLGTVHRLTPGFALRGRLELAGVLRGPWHNLTFQGDLAHRDGDLPESRATGTTTLDTRTDQLAFQSRVNLDPLVFNGIRPSYPGVPVQGEMRGEVQAVGTLSRLKVDAKVEGDLGALQVDGTIHPDQLRCDSLNATFVRLNLAALRGQGPPSSLDGHIFADGTLDTLAGPEGRLEIDLGRGRVAEFGFDSVHARLAGRNGAVVVDTAVVDWLGGGVAGGGRLSWRQPTDAEIRAAFRADTLAPFEPLVARFVGTAPDSGAGRPHGRFTGDLEVLGAAMSPRILLSTRGRAVEWRGVSAPSLAFTFGWNDAPHPEIGAALRADSIALGNWVLSDVDLAAGGYEDSLRWSAQGSFEGKAAVEGSGQWWRDHGIAVLGIDTLLARLPRHDWWLLAPATIAAREGRLDLTPLRLAANDGSGTLSLLGSVPREGPGTLLVDAMGIDLRDVYTLLELDTTGIAGSLQVNLAIGGTANSPTIRGSAAGADLTFGDLGSPFVQGIIDYADRELHTNLLLWKTGTPVVRLEAELPLDLALHRVAHRQVDGPLSVRAVADSTDLGVVEAFTRNLRQVRGTLRADVQIAGSWNQPRLVGGLTIRNGSASVPGLGLRYTDVSTVARLTGDSIVVDTLLAASGEGNMRAAGVVRLEQLTRPVVQLSARMHRFRVMDVRRFLTLDASGTVVLTGPVFRAHLTGRVTADAGNLHFADLLTKRIVDLENPGDSGLIDLDLVRTERLGANFQSRFLDSLTIDTLRIQMGESFWLRSNEANIQLGGDLTVNKIRDRYRYDGTLSALRGNYALRIGGFVTRDFTVDRGTVRYFGTPDLNAALDIEASHTVIDQETSEEIPVIAKITGTMLQPRLELSTPATAQRPALSQTELVSYLMFGRPTFSLQGQAGQSSQYAAVQTGVSYLTSAFSSELQRTLISDLGVPIDYLDIRAGTSGGAGAAGQASVAQVAQVAAGWQIGRKWFVGVVADLCTNAQRFYPNAEFRMSRSLRVKASVEPAYSCQAAQLNPALSTNKYQVGLDLLWEREY